MLTAGTASQGNARPNARQVRAVPIDLVGPDELFTLACDGTELFADLRFAVADSLQDRLDRAKAELQHKAAVGRQEALPGVQQGHGRGVARAPYKRHTHPERPLGNSGTYDSGSRLDAGPCEPCTLSADGPETYTLRAAEQVAEDPGQLRARLTLADRLRRDQTRWPARCLRFRTLGAVQLQRSDIGQVRAAGVQTCGSIWCCPICAPGIYATRAGELTGLVERASLGPGRQNAYLLTLTVRHYEGQPCRDTVESLTACWRRFWSCGRKSVSMRRSLLQVRHYVRGLETTHGPNGWHPHFHVLICARRELGNVKQIERELAHLWLNAARASIPPEAWPDLDYGVTFKLTNAAEYIAKLGLEIASISTKRARRPGHETPWQIAHRAAGDDRSARVLWREYVSAFRGQRQLTWSRGTKAKLAIPELSDEQAAEAAIVVSSVADIAGSDWDTVARAERLPDLFSGCSRYGLGWATIVIHHARATAPPNRPPKRVPPEDIERTAIQEETSNAESNTPNQTASRARPEDFQIVQRSTGNGDRSPDPLSRLRRAQLPAEP